MPNFLNSDYDEYTVWTGTEGPLAEFIEEALDNYESEIKAKEYEKPVFSSNETKAVPKDVPMYVEKPIIESKEPKGPGIQEELIRYVLENTKTVDLLDEFEGLTGEKKPYRRIVVKNTMYRDYEKGIGYNLVIERGKGSNYVGDLTFTAFKKDQCTGLINHIRSEVTETVVKEYRDKDHFYRFSRPYLLRAQNSTNRTGYGWEWDWPRGYGDYTEGTLYGETTNYFFVGVYITTGSEYEPKRRKHEMSSSSAESMRSNTTPVQRYRVVPFIGKLKNATTNPVESGYLEMQSPSGEKSMIQVFYDKTSGNVYIPQNAYVR